MAKGSKSSLGSNTKKPRQIKRRKGVHSKTKASKIKTSKNYLKRYRGQGK
jgi:hypothetical protein